MEKIFSETCRHVFLFLKSEKWHIEVIPHNHTIMGTKEEMQGRCVRGVDMYGGDLSGGESEGELAPFVFIFPRHLPFLGFPLTTS